MSGMPERGETAFYAFKQWCEASGFKPHNGQVARWEELTPFVMSSWAYVESAILAMRDVHSDSV